MNYRHAYHAGNFADVVKHAALALVLDHLSRKDAGWRVIDTHAGIGAYDLSAEEPTRTGEWRAGIARLAPHLGLRLADHALVAAAPAPPAGAREALAPYARALAAANTDGMLRTYPGSPAVARALARRQDRLSLCELHPEDAQTLRARYAGDQNVKTFDLDGWLALGSFVPPKERRGLVLVDPPFEETGEFDRLASGLAQAYARWPTGTYMLWHPVKDAAPVRAYERAIRNAGIPKVVLAELFVRAPTHSTFDGCGLVIVNPPYTLEPALRTLLPYFAAALAQGAGGAQRLDWLAGEA